MNEQERAAFLSLVEETKRMAGSENADHEETIAILAVERELNRLQGAFDDVGLQCAESLALNVKLENRIALAEKVMAAANIIRKEHAAPVVAKICGVQQPDKNCYCKLCVALDVYHTTGNVLIGPGGE